MVKLSDRLQWIADRIQPGETVADIGTDHGLLPIFLYENGISPKVILCDINVGPLKKAEENLLRIFPNEKFGLGVSSGTARAFDLRKGNGLAPLSLREVDTIVIAGMGGLLISDILEAELEKAQCAARLILQPRNHGAELRRWLLGNGFWIYDEALVRERHHICEILCAKPGIGQDAMKPADSLEWEVSPLLQGKGDPLYQAFLEHKIHTEEKIICAIERVEEGMETRADSDGAVQRRQSLLRAQRRREEWLRLLSKERNE